MPNRLKGNVRAKTRRLVRLSVVPTVLVGVFLVAAELAQGVDICNRNGHCSAPSTSPPAVGGGRGSSTRTALSG